MFFIYFAVQLAAAFVILVCGLLAQFLNAEPLPAAGPDALALADPGSSSGGGGK